MIRQCAWCKKVLGEKEPLENKRTTHTICDDCYEKVEREENEEEQVMKEALSEPPFCAWCGGTCHCEEYSDREEQEYCECDLQYTLEELDMNQCACCGGMIK